MMLTKNKENSNTSPQPESINLSMAEMVLKEYALTKVFTKDLLVHLEETSICMTQEWSTVPCSGQSVAYVARYGLNIPSITSVSAPAKHADVLLAHILKMTSVLQNHFAGAIGWDCRSACCFAPYLVRWTCEQHKAARTAADVEFNQLAGGRGGQVAFPDINLYYEMPNHFRDVPAIGPGGKFTGKTYADYDAESKLFLKALFDVYMEGDSRGRPFFFPKPLLHITDYFFKNRAREDSSVRPAPLSSEKGNTYFVLTGRSGEAFRMLQALLRLAPEDLDERSTRGRCATARCRSNDVNLRGGIQVQQ